MGFKFKKFTYVGGSGTWGTATTIRERSEVVLKDFADALIAMNIGWQLDTSRNATTSSFVDVPIFDNSDIIQSFAAPALFFTNTNSGCKLFLCLQNQDGRYSLAFKPPFAFGYANYQNPLLTGIITSIIPGGSSDNFGSSFDDTFLPASATRLAGTVKGTITSTDYQNTAVCLNELGKTYSYGLFASDSCVGFSSGLGIDNTFVTKPIYFAGKILGTLAHTESLPQKDYGVIYFHFNQNTSSGDESQSVVSTASFNLGSENKYLYGYSYLFSGFEATISNEICQIFKADGNCLTFAYNNAYITIQPLDFSLLGSKIQTPVISGLTRWIPWAVGVVSNSPSDYGVVPGDGYKGYLDTNLFRCALVTNNQLYNNGQFIGTENGLLLGWDVSNTDTL